MTIEEKAKAYDETIKKAKELKEKIMYSHLSTESCKAVSEYIDTIIPELAESEDERICKRCIDLLRKVSAYSGEEYLGVEIADCIIGLQALMKKQKAPNARQRLAEWSKTDEGKAKYEEVAKEMREEMEKEQKPVGFPLKDKVFSIMKKLNSLNFMLKLGSNEEKLANEITSEVRDLADYSIDKPAEWKPQPESLEALMYAVEGKWEMIKPTSYLSRRLEDLYDGLINTYSVDETFLAELPKTAYSANDIEELKAMKAKIDASMESPEDKPTERFEEAREKYQVEWSEDWREEDIQTRFAFYTYKEDSSVLYLSNVFVEEASRNHGFGTKILMAAEKVAETIGATTISLKVKQDSPANAWYRKRGYGYVAFEDGYDWLEKNLEYMKPNHNILPIEQQMEAAMIAIRGEMPPKSQEWSEEEKMNIELLIALLRDKVNLIEILDSRKESIITFLKSLRPSWKPSEEQIHAIIEALKYLPNNKDEWMILNTLADVLRKLM